MVELHMPVITKKSFKKYNEITHVYVSTEIHVYTCYHYLKATKCGKYKIRIWYVTWYISCPVINQGYVGNSPMTFYLHRPDLALYPVTDYFRL
jgi:hypothetical protein